MPPVRGDKQAQSIPGPNAGRNPAQRETALMVPTATLPRSKLGLSGYRHSGPVNPSRHRRVHIRGLDQGASASSAVQTGARVCGIVGMKSSRGKNYGTEADDARIRYHLTSLYALRPLPDDLLQLVRRVGERLQSADGGAND